MAEDKVKILGERLKKVVEGFHTMKHLGIDEDILIAFIMTKTRLNKSAVEKMLKATDEFYSKLLKESIIDGLEDDES